MTSVDASAIEQAVHAYTLDRAQRLGDAFADAVRSNAPRRSGALADSVEVEPARQTSQGAAVRVVVNAEYGRFVEEGTGIYGPEGTPIVPRNGNVLVFDWPAAGGIVFARHVRGMEPTHFWARALERWPDIVGSVA